MNLIVSGLIIDIIGVLILVLVAVFGISPRIHFQEKWTRKYWWTGWKPIFKIYPPSEKAYWRIKLSNKVTRCGFIPPKYQWNAVGFLYVVVGFLLQIIGNLR